MGPSQVESNVRVKHQYRFLATNAFNGSITDTSVIMSLGGIVTATNTTLTGWAAAYKIKSVEVFAAPPAQGQSATVSVEWFGFQNSPNLEYSDTSVSTAKNAHIRSAPPKESLCAFWQKYTGTNLFKIICPANSIVTLNVDYLLSDGDAAPAQLAIASGALGNIFYLALDNATGHDLVPIAMTTTF